MSTVLHSPPNPPGTPSDAAGRPAAGPAAAAALPPGPRVPAWALTLAWALAPTWVMDRCAARLGDAFTLTFAPSGLKLAMFSDPEAVKTIFTAPPDVAPSAAGSSPIAPVVGHSSVLVLTGPEHMRQRKLLLPPFHGERMREYEDVIVEATRRDMAGWRLGSPMRLQRHTRQITMEVIVRAVFGVEAERMQPLKDAITGLLEPVRVLAVVRALMSRPSGERPTGAIGRALDRLDALIYSEIAHRRRQSDLERRADIMSLLLQARDEQGEPMTDGELRDELVTLLLAGHETTATSVAWAVERLVRHPDKLRRLAAEIDAGGEQYMTAVVNETLRVRPVVPLVVRMLTQELRVGGYELPAGTRVVPSIYLTNRNPAVYESPREFRPERFLGHTPDTFSWIPFGGGIRRCIGASFALLEMKVMLRTMLCELEPRLPDGRAWRRGELVRRRAITLVPARGASVVWQRRA
ncbi:MAG TPA: cytochrome P450 [Solirubrobacteraceae bacterium]|jgi:cytochrome P450|nr:cytochrome P450 [Solirubrobacteraceae bacterium]